MTLGGQYERSSDLSIKTRHMTAKAIMMVRLVLSSMIQACRMKKKKS